MPQPQHASEEAVERLKRDIANDRARLALAMEMSEIEEPSDEPRLGRLYKVFQATGQAQ